MIIPDWVANHPDFNGLVWEAIQETNRAKLGEFANLLCELDMLKRAMHEAAKRVRTIIQYINQQWEHWSYRIPKIQAVIRAIQANNNRTLDSICREIEDISHLVRPPDGEISRAQQLSKLLDVLAKHVQEEAEASADDVLKHHSCTRRAT